jgi:hypothetical protein
LFLLTLREYKQYRIKYLIYNTYDYILIIFYQVGTEELNDLIEFIYKKRDTKETNNESYARFLRFSNLKLNDVPFYDLRRYVYSHV